MSEAKDVLRGIGGALDVMARTQRGWVGEVASILAGASKVASELLGSGSSPEEIRSMLQDLVDNPPKPLSMAGATAAVDKVIAERKAGSPPKLP